MKNKNYKSQNTIKGGYGFHQGSSLMGTITTFNKKFLRGVQKKEDGKIGR